MNYRFSCHETFPFRYAWLPKAYGALARSPGAFANEEDAMVELGVGKNMVRAICFWVQACGIAEVVKEGGYCITMFGKAIFDKKGGDPYLEDRRTLWLLPALHLREGVEPDPDDEGSDPGKDMRLPMSLRPSRRESCDSAVAGDADKIADAKERSRQQHENETADQKSYEERLALTLSLDPGIALCAW